MDKQSPTEIIKTLTEADSSGYRSGRDTSEQLAAKLKVDAEQRHHKRSEAKKDNIHRLTIGWIWSLSTLAMILILLSFTHLIFPNLSWFQESNWELIDKIVSMVIIGIIGGALKDKIKEYL